jgi:hypothetical protein
MLKVTRHAKLVSYVLRAGQVAPVAPVMRVQWILTPSFSTQALTRPRAQQVRPAKVRHAVYADLCRSLADKTFYIKILMPFANSVHMHRCRV